MRYVVALFVLLDLSPDVAWAQGADSLSPSALPPSSTITQMEALARLQSGNSVRVHIVGEGWLHGSVIRSKPDLVVDTNDRERIVPAMAIDSVLVRHGHARIGAGVGALLGMIVGASAGGCQGPPATSLGQAAAEIGPQIDCGLGHMAAGFAVGMVVGALVGSAMPSWEQRVPTAKASTQ